jgi:SAM-dependent methyltransferase
MQIASRDVVFHHLSLADPNGRLFWWNGELYRGISAERAPLYRDLFNKGIVDELIGKKLIIHSEVSDLKTDDYELILTHRLIPFVSYPYEWCAAMLKDAALVVIDLEMELARHHLSLQDAHPWNVLFDGTTPYYVDFGSIVPAHQEILWPAYEQFCNFFLYPLLLMNDGHGRVARWLLHDYDRGVLKSDLAAFDFGFMLSSKIQNATKYASSIIVSFTPKRLRRQVRQRIALMRTQLLKAGDLSKSRLGFLEKLRQRIISLAPRQQKTEWSDYYIECFPPFTPSSQWTAKHCSVHQVLTDLKPQSVLDVGCNRGWYSLLASHLGCQVVAFDNDEPSVTKLYLDGKENGLSIFPLIMDFTSPSPGYGLCNQSLAPANDRLRCDMVMALGLVHHLVFKRQLDFDQIVPGLSTLSKRWLLLEFIPREDHYVREWWSEKYSWYKLDKLIDTLRRHFCHVRILPSYPEPRTLLLCSK